MKKGRKIALGLLILGSIIVLMVSIDEDVSKDEDNWRKATSPWFQKDFKPGVK